jgi:hypothetical protein
MPAPSAVRPTSAPELFTHLVDDQHDLAAVIIGQRSVSRPAICLLSVFAGLVSVCAITLTAPNLLSLGFMFEQNYNEGWNVYNVQRLIGHEVIYDGNYWRVNNYPIFSFLITAVIWSRPLGLLSTIRRLWAKR